MVATSSRSQRSDKVEMVLKSVLGRVGSGRANRASGSHLFNAWSSLLSVRTVTVKFLHVPNLDKHFFKLSSAEVALGS